MIFTRKLTIQGFVAYSYCTSPHRGYTHYTVHTGIINYTLIYFTGFRICLDLGFSPPITYLYLVQKYKVIFHPLTENAKIFSE